MRKNETGTDERAGILEKAAANFAGELRKRDSRLDEGFRDVEKEFKTIKLFLARTMPEFKREFLEVQRKVK